MPFFRKPSWQRAGTFAVVITVSLSLTGPALAAAGGYLESAYPYVTYPAAITYPPAAYPALPNAIWTDPGGSDGDRSQAERAADAVGLHGGPFRDVPLSAPFANNIAWLANSGIAGGFNDGTFRPGDPINRNAMAAFLFRAAGSPPTSVTGRFVDVPTGAPFHREIEWLASTGITTGFADGSFRPGNTINRNTMAAFLYRAAGSPAFVASATPRFSDVPVGAPFYCEIEWLASTGIADGFANGTFRPGNPINRNAMAAFLHRASDGGFLRFTPVASSGTSPCVVPSVVVDVVDGDTIDVQYQGVVERVRLIGVDAPERGQAGFNEATDFVRNAINVAGGVVELRAGGGNDRDAFGRLRRCVYVDGVQLNAALVAAGHAVVVTSFGVCPPSSPPRSTHR